ncbi:FAD-dependent monooxygenase [Actinoplanes sp. TFC3]|uniref:FAD-dependent monooxygenase n=1 Tax=Actinoplanes sp. TFC3 TaxID=1710355 RepID=UPI00082B703F|nr:FAD-dependent monooxygenase [Actinoplanes sp. TFC3]
MSRVLIVGAGIAGDTLAVLLDRQGWHVTVAELAPTLREGGQTVDLRGGSREVLARLGILQEALNNLVTQRGMAWVDESGRPLAMMPVDAFGGEGFVSKEELLRTDLARVLHAAAGARIEYRFGETVDALDDGEAGVKVTFRSGTVETFDLVVGADGMHSRVRALRFGPEDRFLVGLGVANAWYTLREQAETPPVDGWFLVHNAPGGLLVAARPGHPGTQEINVSFRTTEQLPDRRDRAAQLALLTRTFRDVGWRAHELIARATDAPDFALDTLDQIHVPRWHNGRVVLLGDSAWCASPLSGLGTALALIGAETLADALGAATTMTARSLSAALTDFERRMRPRSDGASKLLPGRVSMYLPRTRFGIHASAFLMRAVQWPITANMLMRLMADRGHAGSDQHSRRLGLS